MLAWAFGTAIICVVLEVVMGRAQLVAYNYFSSLPCLFVRKPFNSRGARQSLAVTGLVPGAETSLLGEWGVRMDERAIREAQQGDDAAGVTGHAEWKGPAPSEMHRASLQRSPGPIGWQRFAHHRLMICWRMR